MTKKGRQCQNCGRGWDSDGDNRCAYCAGPSRIAQAESTLPPAWSGTTTAKTALEVHEAAKRAAVLEEAAVVCEHMMVGGRAWDHDQRVAALALEAAAKNIRALKETP
jgi:hypothetical protein